MKDTPIKSKLSPKDEARMLGLTIVKHSEEVSKLLEGGDEVKALFYTQIYVLLREHVQSINKSEGGSK